MIDLKKIVVATDLSELSLCAVRHACELAHQFGAELHLLTISVYPYVEFAAQCQDYYGVTIEQCEKDLYESCVERINKIDVSPLDDAKVVRTVTQGFVVEEIRSYCVKNEADLLVVGTHGRTGLTHVLMGSVAEELVRVAPCPILTVRDEAHTFVPVGKEVEAATDPG